MTKFFAAPFGLVLFAPLLFAAACTASNVSVQQDAQAVQSGEMTMKTSKPGAAVQFRDMSGKIETSSKSRKIHVQVSDGYDSGTLRVDIVPNPALSLTGALSYTFDMAGSGVSDIVLDVKPLSEGKHYLNYTATAEYGDGQVARAVYAVPIYSGVTPRKSGDTPKAAIEKNSAAPGIITMDAEETIKEDKP